MADLYVVSVTGKIFKEGKVLIVQRSMSEKNYPGKWILPGGKMEYSDYCELEPNTDGLWYGVVEKALRREINEEVNVAVENVQYLVDMVFPRKDGTHTIIVSCTCDWVSGEVILDEDQIDYAWVNLEEAKKYDLIEGVYDELKLAFKQKHIN
jgi:8-oxo-dGTP diphosphatase